MTGCLLLAACQQKQPDPPPAPIVVQVTDAAGKVVAELRPGHPCRAKVEGNELIVGGPPIQATEGSAQWVGSAGSNGTTYAKDGERLARLFPISSPTEAAVIDTRGVAQIRIQVDGDKARVVNGASADIRSISRGTAGSAGPTLVIDKPALTVTGTDDLVLAGLLASPELVPQVRMLAACERVLAKGS